MEASKLFKHMAWANQEIIGAVTKLSEAALDAFAVNPEWTVREIMRHITSSASWYGFRLKKAAGASESELNELHAKLEKLEIGPKTVGEIPALLSALTEADALLLEQSLLPEGEIVRESEGKRITRARSTVLSQSIHHATEHRAQLVDALEAKGFTSINLDDFDLWAYCDKFGE
jgi:uncharacterized damage-inducible protein DinB